MVHGLRGHIDTLSTPVVNNTQPSLPTPEPVAREGSESASERVFFTSESEVLETEEVYVAIIPRSKHNDEESLKAKMTELENFNNYDVYEEVSKPREGNIIGTQWVIVDKEKED